jgi:polysaccharide deacetylase 2 family uncharacterized protein YibQ
LLTIGKNDQQALHLRLIRNAQLSNIAGYAAIIIDDFGYSHNDLVRSFISFPHAITLSIIPGLRESRTIARDAELAKKTYLVHMPMEPLNEPFDDLGFTILAGQDAGLIRMRTRSAFSQLPHAVGLNNHQGSRATADEAVMRILLQELKSLDKFFIDSHTHPSSIGLQIGKQVGLPVEENQLFLDAKDDKAFIRSQMEVWPPLASTQANVIAIGHVAAKHPANLARNDPAVGRPRHHFVPVPSSCADSITLALSAHRSSSSTFRRALDPGDQPNALCHTSSLSIHNINTGRRRIAANPRTTRETFQDASS